VRIQVLAFLTAINLSTLTALTQAADDKEPRPKVSVTGVGKLSTIPDVAEIQVGVRTQAPTAGNALAANNEAMNALHAILKERGVASKDVQTSQIQVTPEYSQPGPRRANDPQGEFVPRVVGYRVDNVVQVTARQVDKLGALLDALVQGGANQIRGIAFRVDEPQKLLDEARKRAMADAKRKAEILAGEAGVVIGPPLQIDEEGTGSVPPPRFASFARAMPMAAAAPMPVAAGEQELSVRVHVAYELKPAK
jgi:uncharacterized protein YggE